MPAFSFYDDYSEAAHPHILSAVSGAGDTQQFGYGQDEYSDLAAQRLCTKLGADPEVHFVSGATQGNLLAMAAMLKPYQAVIAPETAHIAVHETGAIEATGHKVITVATTDGKLTPQLIEPALNAHSDEHMVMPKAVFLTQATELGTIYSLEELAQITNYAHERNLYVYLDGARLAVALAAMDTELSALSALGLDMMLLGGTKNGAMFGEAMIIFNPELRPGFRYHMKQRGALLAKGRYLGLQFARFFDTDNLWMQLGQETLVRGRELAVALARLNLKFMAVPQTNQLFVVLPNRIASPLEKEFGFHSWREIDGENTVARLICSWATPSSEIQRLTSVLEGLLTAVNPA